MHSTYCLRPYVTWGSSIGGLYDTSALLPSTDGIVQHRQCEGLKSLSQEHRNKSEACNELKGRKRHKWSHWDATSLASCSRVSRSTVAGLMVTPAPRSMLGISNPAQLLCLSPSFISLLCFRVCWHSAACLVACLCIATKRKEWHESGKGGPGAVGRDREGSHHAMLDAHQAVTCASARDRTVL